MQFWKAMTLMVVGLALSVPSVEAGHTVTYEDEGVICGFGIIVAVAACAVTEIDSSFLHEWPTETPALSVLTVTLSWDAESPLSEQLLLIVEDIRGNGYDTRIASVPGTSPIVVEVEDVSLEGMLRTRVFNDHYGSVSVHQEFDISVTIQYEE